MKIEGFSEGYVFGVPGVSSGNTVKLLHGIATWSAGNFEHIALTSH